MTLSFYIDLLLRIDDEPFTIDDLNKMCEFYNENTPFIQQALTYLFDINPLDITENDKLRLVKKFENNKDKRRLKRCLNIISANVSFMIFNVLVEDI